ncbi:hypothetical protein K490DRAFT_60333 [Saccharata proteae CBS 121410]|uniref:Uncharacterized protein n=1 Tax=Saccharata proteae CBS 121410 TaxID=1314787 RepID=A0A9P4HN51_9PEZI|nr:hypothetical protein K490DRAFT_60333 [Saccharata proteae CBS 121410]
MAIWLWLCICVRVSRRDRKTKSSAGARGRLPRRWKRAMFRDVGMQAGGPVFVGERARWRDSGRRVQRKVQAGRRWCDGLTGRESESPEVLNTTSGVVRRGDWHFRFLFRITDRLCQAKTVDAHARVHVFTILFLFLFLFLFLGASVPSLSSPEIPRSHAATRVIAPGAQIVALLPFNTPPP